MPNRPLVLLTNDDGIHSPGLLALCEAVLPFGDPLVVAPSGQQTSMGRSYPRIPGLGTVKAVHLGDGIQAFSVVASPATCVLHAVLELAARKPNLCISGINYGENLGKTLTYSGTLGAALQAADFGIPALAISRPAAKEQMNTEGYAKMDWTLAKAVAAFWGQRVLAEGMPFDAPVLNINLPEEGTPLDYRYTFQSNTDPFCYGPPTKRDRAKPYRLPSYMQTDFSSEPPGSDIHTVKVENRISVTPVEGNYTCRRFWQN